MSQINHQFYPSSIAAMLDNAMPGTFYKIFSFIILQTKIDGWRLNKANICTLCGISMSTTKRALRWLVAHGYMAYDPLLKEWQVYPEPITPASNTSAI